MLLFGEGAEGARLCERSNVPNRINSGLGIWIRSFSYCCALHELLDMRSQTDSFGPRFCQVQLRFLSTDCRDEERDDSKGLSPTVP